MDAIYVGRSLSTEIITLKSTYREITLREQRPEFVVSKKNITGMYTDFEIFIKICIRSTVVDIRETRDRPGSWKHERL